LRCHIWWWCKAASCATGCISKGRRNKAPVSGFEIEMDSIVSKVVVVRNQKEIQPRRRHVTCSFCLHSGLACQDALPLSEWFPVFRLQGSGIPAEIGLLDEKDAG
jgi:hypothetical protein